MLKRAGIPFDRLGDLPDLLRSREGRAATYHEGRLVAVVRVDHLHYNDYGVFGTATVVRPPGTGASPGTAPPGGPARGGRDSWQFTAGWGYFLVSPWRWNCCWGGWTLYFDAGLRRDLAALGLDGIERFPRFDYTPEDDPALKALPEFHEPDPRVRAGDAQGHQRIPGHLNGQRARARRSPHLASPSGNRIRHGNGSPNGEFPNRGLCPVNRHVMHNRTVVDITAIIGRFQREVSALVFQPATEPFKDREPQQERYASPQTSVM